jgi:spore coat protein U-like protein
MRSHVLKLAVAGSLMLAAGTAAAATRTTTFGVSAVVNPNCLVTATDLAFGGYDGTAAKTGTAGISVRCTSGASFSVALNAGTTTGGTFAQRLLAGSGANRLQYNLYTTVGATTIWGDNSTGTGIMSGTGGGMASGSAVPFTVFGVLPDNAFNQGAPSGNYSDSILVTVTY